MALSGANITKSFFFRHLFLITVILVVGGGLFYFYYTNDQKLSRITDVADLKIDKNSKYYINDLYISDGRNYEYVLSAEEKIVYDTILNAIKKYQKEVTVDLSDKKFEDFYLSAVELERIQEVMIMDHPELLQLGYLKLAGGNSDNRIYKVEIFYALNKNQYNQAVTQIKQVLEKAKTDTKTMNDYEKAKYVYDYIGKKNVLDTSIDPLLRSAYSALIRGKSANTAYAKAAQLMFQYIKVNSILVSGSYNGEGHEWNLVKIDGKYYHFDVSLTSRYKGQAGIVYTGLLFRNSPDYKLEYKNMIPFVTGKKYEYYSYNNLIFKYDNNFDELKKIIDETKGNVVQLKIKNYSMFYKEANIAKAELKFDAIYFMNEVAIIVKEV